MLSHCNFPDLKMSSGAGLPLNPGLPTTTLQLSISCKGLPKKDTMSKSDPVCVLYVKSKEDWIEIGNDFFVKWLLESMLEIFV